MSTPLRFVLGLAAVLSLVAGLWAGMSWWTASGPDDDASASTDLAQPPPILRYEADGLRFMYHVPTGSESLFDLAADPGCLNNLALERPEETQRLRAALEQELKQTNRALGLT